MEFLFRAMVSSFRIATEEKKILSSSQAISIFQNLAGRLDATPTIKRDFLYIADRLSLVPPGDLRGKIMSSISKLFHDLEPIFLSPRRSEIDKSRALNQAISSMKKTMKDNVRMPRQNLPGHEM